MTHKNSNSCACHYLNTRNTILDQNKNATVPGFIAGVTSNALSDYEDGEK